MIRALAIFTRRAILDGNESLRRRRCAIGVWRRDADVVSLNAELLCQVSSGGVDPSFDVVIPCVGGIAHGLALVLCGRLGRRCLPRRAAQRFRRQE